MYTWTYPDGKTHNQIDHGLIDRRRNTSIRDVESFRELIVILMCLSETYSRVRLGKNLSDIFPIRNGLKQGVALTPLLLNFILEYAIRRFQVN